MRSKEERHRAIQEIVRREEIGTQKELVERLRQMGFDVTQATVSRDITELRLARVALGKGRHKYVLPSLELPEDIYEELKRQFGLFVKDVDRGGNILVVKTAEGHASGIALLVDRLRRVRHRPPRGPPAAGRDRGHPGGGGHHPGGGPHRGGGAGPGGGVRGASRGGQAP